MHKIDAIMADKRFTDRINEINEAEKDRRFCRHGYDHLLSVARIGYILYLQDKVLDYSLEEAKEIIYATALLHDIGRFTDYEKQLGHRQAGPKVARPILESAGFTKEETDTICDAIIHHGMPSEKKGSLDDILYRADKLSRNCFDCNAIEECNWPDEKKIMNVKI